MFLELAKPWPVETSKGPGFVYVLLDYSQDHDTLFLTCINSTGEFWYFKQSEIRAQKNLSLGRVSPDKPLVGI